MKYIKLINDIPLALAVFFLALCVSLWRPGLRKPPAGVNCRGSTSGNSSGLGGRNGSTNYTENTNFKQIL